MPNTSTSKYLVSWVISGTMNMGTEIVRIKEVMNITKFNGLQKRLRKQHGSNLRILSFSKFEGHDLPVIDVEKVYTTKSEDPGEVSG